MLLKNPMEKGGEFEALLQMPKKQPPAALKAGARPSRLAEIQARSALDNIQALLPGVSFELQLISSAGDADRTTDLRESPADFFTRELDGAVLRKEIDMAVHSAKDCVLPTPEALDWFWLPWRAEARDVLVLARGRSLSDLPRRPIVGISSQRRAAYCNKRFPNGIQRKIRGHIEERIAQVEQGDFDIVIMAAAALLRLGMEEYITEWIPLEELETPEGQGCLAVTFRKGDERMKTLRSLFMHAAVFAGAGAGSKTLLCTATLHALKRCDICLHDSLIDKSLLKELPPFAQIVDVGKRCGTHSRQQHETTRLMCRCVRKGQRMVRLKGGDPGIFGRLAEETEALEQLGIPFRVIPGISALQAATTGTGMLLTRRDVSRGFVVFTPRMRGGMLARCDAEMKNRLPIVYYMSIGALRPISQLLLEDGHAPDTPAALVFNAGGVDEKIVRTTLINLSEASRNCDIRQPGLIIVGEIAAYGYKTDLGALRGKRVLLTCSEALQEKAADWAFDLGGRPVSYPLIALQSRRAVKLDCTSYDWLVVSSPSSVQAFMEIAKQQKIDMRSLPKIMVCGRGTAAAFEEYGIWADVQPESRFSTDALKELAKKTLRSTQNILRIRSDKAGKDLADALRETGARVDDAIIYNNVPVVHEQLPLFDAVFFASASGVESFIAQWGAQRLEGKIMVVIGGPTAKALEKHRLQAHVIARESTVSGVFRALAAYLVIERLADHGTSIRSLEAN